MLPPPKHARLAHVVSGFMGLGHLRQQLDMIIVTLGTDSAARSGSVRWRRPELHGRLLFILDANHWQACHPHLADWAHGVLDRVRCDCPSQIHIQLIHQVLEAATVLGDHRTRRNQQHTRICEQLIHACIR